MSEQESNNKNNRNNRNNQNGRNKRNCQRDQRAGEKGPRDRKVPMPYQVQNLKKWPLLNSSTTWMEQ